LSWFKEFAALRRAAIKCQRTISIIFTNNYMMECLMVSPKRFSGLAKGHERVEENKNRLSGKLNSFDLRKLNGWLKREQSELLS
jgi:hypothetical protein